MALGVVAAEQFGKISPDIWKIPAIVEFLVRLLDGHDCARVLCGFGRAPAERFGVAARARGAVECSVEVVQRFRALATPPRSPQKYVLEYLLKTWLPCDLVHILKRRASALVGAAGGQDKWKQFLAELPKLAVKGGCRRAALSCLRLTLNALPTTARTQADRAACIFGCPRDLASDSCAHYLKFPRARRITAVATVAPPPPDDPLIFLSGGDLVARHGILQLAVLSRLIVVASKCQISDTVKRLGRQRKLRELGKLLVLEAQSIANDYGGRSFIAVLPAYIRAG